MAGQEAKFQREDTGKEKKTLDKENIWYNNVVAEIAKRICDREEFAKKFTWSQMQMQWRDSESSKWPDNEDQNEYWQQESEKRPPN